VELTGARHGEDPIEKHLGIDKKIAREETARAVEA
jgi:hypothetical protein